MVMDCLFKLLLIFMRKYYVVIKNDVFIVYLLQKNVYDILNEKSGIVKQNLEQEFIFVNMQIFIDRCNFCRGKCLEKDRVNF